VYTAPESCTLRNVTAAHRPYGMNRSHKPKMRARTMSAGVVVLRREADDWQCLLLRAFRYWDFPKGKVEAGELPQQAAIRETEEETTITELEFHWGDDTYLETGPYAQGKIARYYIAQTTQFEVGLPVNPEIGRAEHEEYRWLTFDQALKIASPRVAQVIRWAQEVVAGGVR
jgi:8-oxo-dGTP pyrophosphatase MutT (NUDIX family)